MFSTIVVGTDGSASAAIAVDHARRLAVTAGATLVVVSAFRPPDHVLLSGLADAEMFMPEQGRITDGRDPRIAAEEIVRHLVRAATAAGVKSEGIVRPGGAARVIGDVATWKGADLIVVGDRGMPAGHRRLGSVPNQLSHHAPCSLLIVPTGAGAPA